MDTVIRSIEASIAAKRALLANKERVAAIRMAAETLIRALRGGHRVLWCGNGGSAADAQHLAAELSGRFYYDRPPLNSEALHCNTSYMTAVANDYGYDTIYSRMINGACHPGDILVGKVTPKGETELTAIAMTGESGGKMKELADILLNVPSTDTPRIQECHIMIGHIICEIVEKEMFPRD